MNLTFARPARPLALSLLRWLSLACIVVFSARYAQEIAAGGDPWKTADWLIDYSGGWVRRGLLGTVWAQLPLQGPTLLWSLFGAQVACYLGIWHLLLRQLERQGLAPSPLTWALLASPAFVFLFPLYDPTGGFRKEILAFLALGLLLRAGVPGTRSCGRWVLAGAALYAVAAWAHEGQAFFLPLFLAAAWRLPTAPGRWQALRGAAMAAMTLAAATAVVGAWLAPGDAGQATRICATWVQRGLSPSLCGGAIEWLGYDTSRVTAALRAQWGRYLLVYAPLLLLSLAPLLLAARTRLDRGVLLAGLAGALPLFIVAADWGRWIHIHATLCTLYLLHRPAPRPGPAAGRWALAAVLLYATLWSLPTCCAQRPGLGLLSLWPGLGPLDP